MKTAEEMIKPSDVVFVNKLSENEIAEISFVMREFAKLHVKAALKTASKNAVIYDGHEGENYRGGSYYIVPDSILNAYPEENIL